MPRRRALRWVLPRACSSCTWDSVESKVSKLLSDGKWSAATAELTSSGPFNPSKDSSKFNTLLSSVARDGSADDLRSSIREMIDVGVDLDQLHCYQVLEAMCSKARIDEAMDFLDSMVGEGVQANQRHFHVIIDACAQHGRMAEIESLVAKMGELRIRKTFQTYHVLLNAFKLQGETDAILSVIEDMCETKKRPPTERAVTICIQALFMADCDENKIKDTFKRLVELGMTTSTPLVNVLLKYTDSGNQQRLHAIVDIMQKWRVRPSHITLTALASRGYFGTFADALRLIEKFGGSIDASTIDGGMLKSLSIGFRRSNDARSMYECELSRRAMGCGEPADLRVIFAIADRTGDYELMVKLFEECYENPKLVDPFTSPDGKRRPTLAWWAYRIGKKAKTSDETTKWKVLWKELIQDARKRMQVDAELKREHAVSS